MHYVTNIQKFSIHDGDGIRTTVFFKGCPLSCVWCHNPETQLYPPQLEFNRESCTGCGYCERRCSEGAVAVRDGKAETDPAKCLLCGRCVKACPSGARNILGREYTVPELVREVLKDRMFYEQSGGGVTLSGGEVMTIDTDYLKALCRELHREGIDLAVDTCGQAPFERFEEILPYVSTFLYDVKCMDLALHRAYTGADNRLILSNLVRLAEAGAKICIRIPVIREFNGNEGNMQETIVFLKENRIAPVQINLLPYHDTGSGKYPRIGREYPGSGLHAPTAEELQEFQKLFQNAGFINTRIGG